MSDWRSIVEKQNAKMYAWPAGWDTRETIALQLECSSERVAQILAPGIKAGEVETNTFPVWDKQLKRVTRIVGYRVHRKEEATKQVTQSTGQDLVAAVLEAARRFPGARPSALVTRLPRRFRGKVLSAAVVRILEDNK